MIKTLIIALCIIVILSGFCFTQNIFPALTGPYLGQKPPGTRPELFADGIIANKYHSFHTSLMFTPDKQECYWKAKLSEVNRVIVFSKIENNHWTSPEKVSFSKKEYKDDAPFISPDGKSLFFTSRRPIEKGVKSNKENIWVVGKKSDGWGEPKPLPQIINSIQGIHWQISVDDRGNLFFSTVRYENTSRNGDIYCSKFINGEYTDPVKLDTNINSSDYDCAPFIAKDGTYLIFTRESKNGSCKIYISFQDEDENWSNATNLFDNYGIKGICPIVSNDCKYLFFLDYVNSHSQPFWVDAKFIEELKLKENNN